MKINLRTIITVSVLAIFVYGVMLFFSEGIIFPSFGIVTLLCFMTLFDYLIKSYRWKLLLSHYGMNISFIEAVKTYLAGLVFVVTPGKIGSIVKAELMQVRQNFSRKKVGFVVILERAFDMIAHLILGGFTAFLVATEYLKSLWMIFAFFVLGFVGLYFFRNKLNFIKEELEKLNDFKLIITNTVLSVVSWAIEDFELLLAVWYFSGSITPAQAFFVFSASLILGNITLIPGGLGVAEASATGLLILFGLEKSVSTSVILLTRFSTLWFGFVLGTVFWFTTYKTQKTPKYV